MSAALDMVKTLPSHIRPLRRAEYEHLVETGAFGDERVELLRGMLVRKSPQDPLHADAVRRLQRVIGRALPADLDLQTQLPFAATDDSEPEPDLAVVPARRYRDAHPDRAALVIEVGRISHASDLGPKVGAYAQAGVGEYWVVDLVARAVVVFRRPSGDGYRDRSEHHGGLLRPTSVPGVAVDLDDLFG